MSRPAATLQAETLDLAIRDMNARDLNEVVALDATATGRPDTTFFAAAIHRLEARAERSGPGGPCPESAALVADFAGQVVGYVVGHLVPGPNPAEPTGLIESIAVRPAWRGRQIGTRLMRTLRERLGCEAFAMEPRELSWKGVDLSAFFRDPR